MRATIIVAIYGVCAVALLTFYAIYQWLTPTMPLLIGAAAVLVPSFVIVFALEEDARPPNINIMLLAQTALLAGIFGLAVPALWTVPAVRARALTTLPSMRSVEAAMSDEQAPVRLQACKLMFDSRVDARRDQIVGVLASRPDVASACLTALGDDETADYVTRRLAVAWHNDLVQGDGDQCPKVAAIDALPIDEGSRTGLVLDCALQSGNDAARKCCTAHLAAAHPGEKLQSAARAGGNTLTRLGTSGFLLAAAFNEKGYVASIAPTTEQLGLQSDAFKQLSLELACNAVVAEAGRPDDMKYLEWLFNQNTTCIEDLNAGTTDVVSSCDEFLTFSMADRKDVGAALCRANQATRKKKRENAAAFKTGAAFGDDAPAIDQGRAALQGKRLSPQNFAELMKSGEFADMTPDQRALMINKLSGQATFNPKDPVGLTKEQIEANGVSANTKEGREKMMAEYQRKMKEEHGDIEKALGVSMEELQGSLDENGEMSDEMKEKLAKKKAAAKQKPPAD